LLKQEVETIIDKLPEDANWDDLMKELYRSKKITYGMTDLEVVQNSLSDSEINTILARIKSSSHMPDDMRNTKSYQPGNAATLGMVSGLVAMLFALVFPPIAWVAAAVAAVAGVIGMKNAEDKAWVPVLMAAVSILPMFAAF